MSAFRSTSLALCRWTTCRTSLSAPGRPVCMRPDTLPCNLVPCQFLVACASAASRGQYLQRADVTSRTFAQKNVHESCLCDEKGAMCVSRLPNACRARGRHPCLLPLFCDLAPAKSDSVHLNLPPKSLVFSEHPCRIPPPLLPLGDEPDISMPSILRGPPSRCPSPLLGSKRTHRG